jgi:hypothetical protein
VYRLALRQRVWCCAARRIDYGNAPVYRFLHYGLLMPRPDKAQREQRQKRNYRENSRLIA